MLADLSQAITELVASSFKVAVQLSAPFYVLGLLFFVCLGVLARLMPQLQIFFVAVPINIVCGFLLMLALLGSLMSVFLNYYSTQMAQFL